MIIIMYDSQILVKKAGRVGNWRTNRDHPNYTIIKISQNTEKSPWIFKENCCDSDFSERQSANVGVKNSQEVI